MPIQTSRNKSSLSLLTLVLIVGLSACGAKDDKKPATQIAAKVNSEEISVHQINFVLSRSGITGITPEQAPKLRREILEKLIDQQLAVEQAVEKKLDRSPDVLMALEAARREILARAYAEQLSSTLSKPTADEIKKYYAEHPPLFAERRIYNVQEIVLPASPAVVAPLREMLSAGKSTDEIARWLREKDIKFAAGNVARPAEQIPLELLPKMNALKEGQGLIVENAQNITLIRMLASQPAPVTEATATPRIQQFLGNQRAAEAVIQDLKQIKSKAKITYQGEFASADGGPAAVAPAPAPAADAAKTTAIEKGVAGLK